MKTSMSGLVQYVNPIRWPRQVRALPKRDCGDYSVGAHLFPFRTEKLSPTAPMVLPYRWESRSSPNTIEPFSFLKGFFCNRKCVNARTKLSAISFSVDCLISFDVLIEKCVFFCTKKLE